MTRSVCDLECFIYFWNILDIEEKLSSNCYGSTPLSLDWTRMWTVERSYFLSILSKNFHLKFIITKPYKIQQKHRTNEFQLWFFGHHLVLLLILSRWHDMIIASSYCDHHIMIIASSKALFVPISNKAWMNFQNLWICSIPNVTSAPWNISKCQDMGTAGGVLQGNLETRNYSHLSSQQCTDMTFDLQNDSAIVLKRSNLRAIKVGLKGSLTLNVVRVFSFISYVLCLTRFMHTN